MSYTPFGELFRILRIKNHEILSDAGKFLNVTSAYISSVECGKRPVPEEWIALISEHYNLNSKEHQELVQAVEDSKTNIKLDLKNTSYAQRNVALQFQRSFDDLNDETAKEILKILERNNSSGL